MASKPLTPGSGVNVSPFITPTRPPPVVSLVPNLHEPRRAPTVGGVHVDGELAAVGGQRDVRKADKARRMRLVQRGHFPARCLRGNDFHR
jgi:hypothetical protein